MGKSSPGHMGIDMISRSATRTIQSNQRLYCPVLPIISVNKLNPSPESRYTLPLQTVLIQISWFLKKPTDLDLHCLPLSI